MSRHSGSQRCFTSKGLVAWVSVGLVSVVLSGIVSAQPATKDEAMKLKAQWEIQIAAEEYSRGLYKEAQQRLSAMGQYEQYMSDKDHKAVKQLLSDIQQAQAESDKKAKQVVAVDEKPVPSSPQEKPVPPAVQEKPVEQPDAVVKKQEPPKQETPPVIVAQTKPQTPVKPEQEAVVAVAAPPSQQPVSQPVPQGTAAKVAKVGKEVSPKVEPLKTEQQQPVVQEEPYIEKIIQRQQQSKDYTDVVVKDAQAKAGRYLADNEFDKARESLAAAVSTVNRYKLVLGEQDYNNYSKELDILDVRIESGRAGYIAKQEEQKRKDLEQLQVKQRQTMEKQRQSAISDYMERAYAFQEQQRYEEALGQLEQLLVIDPTNHQAQVNKKVLEDTIRWMEQADIQKQSNKEELRMLMEAERQQIPNIDDITYPKTWLQMTQRRKDQPYQPSSPEDLAVLKQLQEVVDISDLTEETSITDAIVKLCESVAPNLPITVLWKDVEENGFITPDSPIRTKIPARVTLEKALQIMLEGVSTGFQVMPLSYIVEGGVVKVATKESLPTHFSYFWKVYDVSELTHAPAMFEMMGMMGGGGMGMGGGGMGMGGGGMGGGGGGMGMGGGGMGMGGGGMGGGGGGMGMGGGGMGMGGGGMGMGGGGMGMGGGGMGMGGGGMGGGGMGGGGMGGGGMGGSGSMMAYSRIYELANIVTETVAPDSWEYADMGGLGRAWPFSTDKLVVWQTAKIHDEIKKWIDEMVKALGSQIAIEARLLLVDENFLRDIGIDVTIGRLKVGGKWGGGTKALENIQTGVYESTLPSETKISSTLGKVSTNFDPGSENVFKGGIGFGATYGTVNDDLQVDFLVRATERHGNGKTLTAPKVMVLNGESASFMQNTFTTYKSNSEFETETVTAGTTATTVAYWTHDNDIISTGINMSITPVIKDKKYVLLRIMVFLNDLLQMDEATVVGIHPQTSKAVEDTYKLPQTQMTNVQTRVCVPDRGTVLLGGLTMTAERELESGVPILGKLPLVGPLFSSRSSIKDKQVLLILVKPTIVYLEEAEQDAVGAMKQ